LAIIFILVSQPVFVAGGEMITLQKENSGQEITLRVGNLLRIELSGIGGTGYSWHIINLDPQCLKLISAETGKIPETGRIGGLVRHILARNPSSRSTRKGTITIAGSLTFTISQKGGGR
jgi:hypothetical protein